MKIINKYELVTLDVFYHMPDYHNIIQEFIIQFDDIIPEFPRIHKFLNFWKSDIKAAIQNVYIFNSAGAELRSVKHNFRI